ncbi:histidine kinase dimerization/phosphoacceptor domain -containing protein [Mesorhizobium sp. VNQ89]|uniref:sensor histidine kinase n=1 Tax=Mesorhizobium quangtriensis TaxID=3157709 RepID=UPI0032B79E9A
MPDVKVHILYVDDDAALVRLVERACRRRGYSLSHASSVADGLAMLEAIDCSVVVLDHELRGETGLDFLGAVNSKVPRPPVIYVTASTDAAVAVGALKAGASDYVIKSASGDFLELLFSAIEQSLEKARLERAKARAELEVREARDRAELMLHEVNHRIANSLSLVASLVRLQSSVVHDDSARSALTETQGRIQAIAKVHQRLYRSTDVQRVALDDYVRDLVTDLEMGIQSQGGSGSIQMVLDPVKLPTDKAVSIGVVLTELVTNAVKYAYPDAAGGPVRVTLSRLMSNKARLSVEDDGVGWDGTGTAQGTGLGTKVIGAMLLNLGSTLSYQKVQQGTRTFFEFDL